jgi:hypothetical protein
MEEIEDLRLSRIGALPYEKAKPGTRDNIRRRLVKRASAPESHPLGVGGGGVLQLRHVHRLRVQVQGAGVVVVGLSVLDLNLAA